MSIVAAVKKAVDEGLGDYWMLHLPETCAASEKISMMDAYFTGSGVLARENRDESMDVLIMRAAVYAREKYGVRGLCFPLEERQ